MGSTGAGFTGSAGSVEYFRRLLMWEDERDSESVPSPFTLRLGCSDDNSTLSSGTGAGVAGVAGTAKPGRFGNVALRGRLVYDVEGSVALRPSGVGAWVLCYSTNQL